MIRGVKVEVPEEIKNKRVEEVNFRALIDVVDVVDFVNVVNGVNWVGCL